MESQQYKLYTKSNSKKLFAIIFALWLFVVGLYLSATLLDCGQKSGNVIAAGDAEYILAIDLNLDNASAESVFPNVKNISYSASFTWNGTPDNVNSKTGELGVWFLDENITYTDYMLQLSIWSGGVYSGTVFTINSVDLTTLYKAFSDAGKTINKTFEGFTLFYPTSSITSNETTITSSENSCIFSSTENVYKNSYMSNGNVSTGVGGFILHAEWADMGPTNADVTVNIAVQGANNSGVIVYLKKGGVMLAQLAQASNGSIVIKNLNVGETYELLISKPYMWSITATGSGELSGCKYTYTVQDPTTDADINTFTLSFSGGGTSNNVVIL